MKNNKIRRHKFNAVKAETNGIMFHSTKERDYYIKLMDDIGKDTLFVLRQVPIHLPGGVKYIVDFVEFRADNTVHFVDVKGMQTKEFKIKKKIIESIYPIEIEVV